MVRGYSQTLVTGEVEETYLATATVDGGDLNGVNPAMDYLDLDSLDGGEL